MSYKIKNVIKDIEKNFKAFLHLFGDDTTDDDSWYVMIGDEYIYVEDAYWYHEDDGTVVLRINQD